MRAYKENVIYYPKTTEQALPIAAVFSKHGIPGAVGSTDCTHIPWGRCPAAFVNNFTGKEGYPTVAYQITCDYHKRILWVIDGHPCSRNDKSIVRFDNFVMGIHRQEILNEMPFTHNLLRRFTPNSLSNSLQWLVYS